MDEFDTDYQETFETTFWKDLKGKEYSKYLYAALKKAKKKAFVAATPCHRSIHDALDLVGQHIRGDLVFG